MNQLGRAVAPLGTCSAIAVATALPADAPPRKWQRHNFTACRKIQAKMFAVVDDRRKGAQSWDALSDLILGVNAFAM
jgi:hypothetical protein